MLKHTLKTLTQTWKKSDREQSLFIVSESFRVYPSKSLLDLSGQWLSDHPLYNPTHKLAGFVVKGQVGRFYREGGVLEISYHIN